MAKIKGSGRGLDAIFIDNFEAENTGDKLKNVNLNMIEPEQNQPRTVFDRQPLEELASSIAVHGLLQPIVVREGENGYYRIIAGERRWRASKMAGLSEVPVIVIDADDRKAAELSLIENIQREDLNAIEEALAYRSLIEEYDLTQDEVSSKIGKSRSAISNSMRLLELPEAVTELVKKNELSAGHARALLGLNDRSDITDIALQTAKKGLSVRATEELVRSLNKKAAAKKQEEPYEPTVAVDYIAELEKRVTSQMGRQFKIKAKGKCKKIEIEYSDDNELERIIKQLCGQHFFDEE